jgi:hypothetical protein
VSEVRIAAKKVQRANAGNAATQQTKSMARFQTGSRKSPKLPAEGGSLCLSSACDAGKGRLVIEGKTAELSYQNGV